MTSRAASFKSNGSIAAFLLANNARSREIISDARLPSRIVRRAVSLAPSILGRLAASIRRQVLAFVTMPDNGWFTSCAIEAVKALREVTRDVCELRSYF